MRGWEYCRKRFVPFLASIGALRLMGVSCGPSPESLARPVRKFARATILQGTRLYVDSAILTFPSLAAPSRAGASCPDAPEQRPTLHRAASAAAIHVDARREANNLVTQKFFTTVSFAAEPSS
jgi:hypothetical protein